MRERVSSAIESIIHLVSKGIQTIDINFYFGNTELVKIAQNEKKHATHTHKNDEIRGKREWDGSWYGVGEANSLSLYKTDIWIDDLNVDPMTLNSATWYINLAQVVRVAHKIVIRLLHSVTTTTNSTSKPINTCSLRICYTIHARSLAFICMYIVDFRTDSYTARICLVIGSDIIKCCHVISIEMDFQNKSKNIVEEKKKRFDWWKSIFFYKHSIQLAAAATCLWVLFRHFVLVCVSVKFFRMCVGEGGLCECCLFPNIEIMYANCVHVIRSFTHNNLKYRNSFWSKT